MSDLDVPDGMGVIVRTAGSERSKAEIKRDFEYLLRLWDEIRDLTLQSTAPALIYEEGNLIKRSIRDLYTRDIEEVLVDGEDGYRTAKTFMKMLMPSHAKRVKPYRDPSIAAVPSLSGRKPDRRDPLAGRAVALGRLHRHQPDRGAGRDRRQFRPRRRASATSKRPRSRPISKPPRKSRGNCACATSPG